MSQSQDMEALGTKLPPEEKQQFRVLAAENGTTMSDRLRQLIREDLRQE